MPDFSSEFGPPHPLTRKQVLPPPPMGPRGETPTFGEVGVRGPNSDEGTDTLVLYVSYNPSTDFLNCSCCTGEWLLGKSCRCSELCDSRTSLQEGWHYCSTVVKRQSHENLNNIQIADSFKQMDRDLHPPPPIYASKAAVRLSGGNRGRDGTDHQQTSQATS